MDTVFSGISGAALWAEASGIVVDYAALSIGCTCSRTRVNTVLIHTGEASFAVSIKQTLRTTPQLRIPKVSRETFTCMLISLLMTHSIGTTGVWNARVVRWGRGLRNFYNRFWSDGWLLSLWDDRRVSTG